MATAEEARLAAPAKAPAPTAGGSVTVIEPPRGWQLVNVRELWRFRELLFFLAWRDVKVRYKQTVLGAAWAVLQPAMMMIVFTIFFGNMGRMAEGVAPGQYPIFVLAGLLPWTFFATAVTGAAGSVLGSERLITKIYFPRLAVPFAAVGAAVVDFAVSCGLLGVMMAVRGVELTPQLLLAPALFGIILLAATGAGTLLAALTVNYRDFRYVIPFLIQLGMFATPTLYMQPTGSETGVQALLLTANPMTSLIAGFRACVLGGPVPWAQVGVAFGAAVALFGVGCLYFRKVEDGFADSI